MAGFFDGEGHFAVRSGFNTKRSGGQTFKVCISQKNPAILEWFQSYFDGGIYQSGNRASQWEVTGSKGVHFLELILPYLLIRADDARYFLGMWAIRTNREEVQRLWENRPWKKESTP